MILTPFDCQYLENLKSAARRRRAKNPGTNERCKRLGVSPGTVRHQADALMRTRAALSMDDACHAVLDSIARAG